MPKIIYVPQGFSARLTKASLAYGIEGLYSDGYSSCNIVICISQNKIVLMHVDIQTLPEKVQEEIEWVDDPKEIIIIYRKNDKLGGQHVKNQLLNHLSIHLPNLNITEEKIDDDKNGILVSFNTQQQIIIHSHVKLFSSSEKPDELLHHPQEQQFLAVQKIEQVIGVREKYLTQEYRIKNFIIFDGRAWEPMEETELKLDSSHQLTKQEINFFSKNDAYITIAGKLVGIINEVKKKVSLETDINDFVFPISIYLEGYLNNFDYELLLKRNLKEMINCDKYTPQSSEDKKFKENLNKLLDSDFDLYEEVKKIVTNYKSNLDVTDFKKTVLDEIQTFIKHYIDRKYYFDIKKQYAELKTKGIHYNKQAIKNYSEKKYQEAFNLFKSALQFLTYCCLKSEPELATVYFNTGRTLYYLQQYKGAQSFIQISLILREQYTRPVPNLNEIKKTRNALTECSIMLEENIQSDLNIFALPTIYY